MLIPPRDFITEYVDPSIELYRADRTLKRLAVHAIPQTDNLAEVVALCPLLNGRTMPAQGKATPLPLPGMGSF